MGIYKTNLNSRIESLDNSNLSDANKELIVSFADYCFTEGLSELWVLKYISTLKSIALSIDVNFDEADEKNNP
jgi:hypothetical protein